MPAPSATRLSIYSDAGLRTPLPTYPYQKDPYEDYDMFGGIGERPVSGISYRPNSRANHNNNSYNRQLGGTDMATSLPRLHRSKTVIPTSTYERQVRQTPNRSQSQSWGGDEDYQIDDSAGMPSRQFFRKSYSLPLSRSGRSGGQWRHIKQATGQTGSNILFIEGTVKDEDVRQFPPFGILQPEIRYNNLGQRMLPRRTSYGSEFNSRAKKGFQYWYKEPKSNISQRANQPVRTISGHQMTTAGVGFFR